MPDIDLFSSAVDAMAHLIGGKDDRPRGIWPKVSIAAYDGFDLIDGRMEDDGSANDFIDLSKDPSDTPFWPMDSCWGAYDTDNGGWTFQRASTLKLKQWRGRLRYMSSKMFELSATRVMTEGATVDICAPYAVIGKKIVSAGTHNLPMVRDGSEGSAHFAILMAQGIELRREYLWSILLGEEGVPRARFATDPIGVREAFRLRDIPAGKARRVALRHWVAEHWRKTRSPSEADRTFVRDYMRGATAFGWNGLSCVIEPSREDVRRNVSKNAA